MVYAAPMNENHDKAVWATGRSPLLDSCHSWLNNIFMLTICLKFHDANASISYSAISYLLAFASPSSNDLTSPLTLKLSIKRYALRNSEPPQKPARPKTIPMTSIRDQIQ
jgi:hypothetical protein